MSFSTAAAPSSQVAFATKASVEAPYGSPTVMPHSCSTLATRSGKSSNQEPAPTANAFWRTTSGT